MDWKLLISNVRLFGEFSIAVILILFIYFVYLSFQLSINGDKEFLDNAHKVNPYHLSPVIAVPIKQSEESQEAGPLPVKVDLNKTCV